jgi:DNA-binding LacI/PurR family transcriptional regulator
MGTVTTSLRERAQSIFDDLGYTVSPNGAELRAERKWRVVRVTPMAEPGEPPTSGDMRCFVTWAEHVERLERRLERADPDYDWAIIGIEADRDDYVVAEGPAAD